MSKTDEEYIRMCRCSGLTRKRLCVGDVYAYTYEDKDGNNVDASDTEDGFTQCPYTQTWLPRQDQLQEMVYRFDLIHHHIMPDQMEIGYRYPTDIFAVTKEISKFSRFSNSVSMEQLWLAFVMKIKFNKVWNGKNWE